MLSIHLMFPLAGQPRLVLGQRLGVIELALRYARFAEVPYRFDVGIPGDLATRSTHAGTAPQAAHRLRQPRGQGQEGFGGQEQELSYSRPGQCPPGARHWAR